MPRQPGPFTLASTGVLAAVAGIAAGHLTAALTGPAAAPVLAIGSTVVDATPTPVKEWAIRTFGTWDKPILLASVVLGALVLAGLCGLLARRSLRLGVAGLVLLAALTAAAALTRPAARPIDVLPGLATAGVGAATLRWLLRPAKVADEPTEAAAHPARHIRRPKRREVLLVAAAAAVLGTLGEGLIRAAQRVGDVVLPKAARPLPELPGGLEQTVSGISSFVTPNADFYRVDTNLTVPVVDVDTWSLTIDGDVREKLRLSFEDLRSMPLVEHDITLTCVSNEVGGQYVGAARWLGVPLTDLLERAGVGSRADQILSTAVDGFTISTPLDLATDGRNTLVAIGMNGEPLPRDHGFPCRLVTPGIYGFVGATKWLTKLTLTTYADQAAYWTKRKWATDAPIKLSSRVDTPQALSTIKAGRTAIGGVAWAQPTGVAGVEVRVDGGRWQPATLGPDAGHDYWRQWYLPWTAELGQHAIAVRATDREGTVQGLTRATPFPDGSSGIQEIVVTVE